MNKRKSPKRAPTIVWIDATVVVEAAMTAVREGVKYQVKKLGWQLTEEMDGPSLRIKYRVPITLE
jgi:hypothetical protein